MMQELARVHYLQAMGVTSYVPRFVLPAAKPSVLCEIPSIAIADPASALSDIRQVLPDAAPTLIPIADTEPSSDTKGVPVDDTPVPATTSAVHPGSSAGSIAPFCLLFVTTDSGLLFVADIPLGREAQMWTDNGMQFIHDVLLAVNNKASMGVSENFYWPISRHLLGGETEALQALSGFTQRQQQDRQLTDVVAMGAKARYFMSKLLPHDSVSLYQAYSLKSLFENPRHKAMLWKALQPLVVR